MSEIDQSYVMVIVILGGYVLGSVPFGLVLTRLAGIGDIRQIGSGNIGATNVLRTGNKFLAFLTVLLDGGKGGVAVLLAGVLSPEPTIPFIAGAMAVLGHNFPIWLKFKGGKGVATSLGTLLAAAWPVGIAVCLAWLLVALTLRYSSLSAIISLGASPVIAWLLMPPPDNLPLAIMAGVLGGLTVVRHQTNIRRLLNGEEPRIGSKGS